ncbi:unnamed protein product [Amoebophrya sp. A120]|nr:unnamed protein product [Amoebophrya sp. A120]|eukprot:GSA120T00009342001.1
MTTGTTTDTTAGSTVSITQRVLTSHPGASALDTTADIAAATKNVVKSACRCPEGFYNATGSLVVENAPSSQGVIPSTTTLSASSTSGVNINSNASSKLVQLLATIAEQSLANSSQAYAVSEAVDAASDDDVFGWTWADSSVSSVVQKLLQAEIAALNVTTNETITNSTSSASNNATSNNTSTSATTFTVRLNGAKSSVVAGVASGPNKVPGTTNPFLRQIQENLARGVYHEYVNSLAELPQDYTFVGGGTTGTATGTTAVLATNGKNSSAYPYSYSAKDLLLPHDINTTNMTAGSGAPATATSSSVVDSTANSSSTPSVDLCLPCAYGSWSDPLTSFTSCVCKNTFYSPSPAAVRAATGIAVTTTASPTSGEDTNLCYACPNNTVTWLNLNVWAAQNGPLRYHTMEMPPYVTTAPYLFDAALRTIRATKGQDERSCRCLASTSHYLKQITDANTLATLQHLEQQRHNIPGTASNTARMRSTSPFSPRSYVTRSSSTASGTSTNYYECTPCPENAEIRSSVYGSNHYTFESFNRLHCVCKVGYLPEYDGSQNLLRCRLPNDCNIGEFLSRRTGADVESLHAGTCGYNYTSKQKTSILRHEDSCSLRCLYPREAEDPNNWFAAVSLRVTCDDGKLSGPNDSVRCSKTARSIPVAIFFTILSMCAATAAVMVRQRNTNLVKVKESADQTSSSSSEEEGEDETEGSSSTSSLSEGSETGAVLVDQRSSSSSVMSDVEQFGRLKPGSLEGRNVNKGKKILRTTAEGSGRTVWQASVNEVEDDEARNTVVEFLDAKSSFRRFENYNRRPQIKGGGGPAVRRTDDEQRGLPRNRIVSLVGGTESSSATLESDGARSSSFGGEMEARSSSGAQRFSSANVRSSKVARNYGGT